MRAYAADTLSLIVYSTVAGAFTELVLAGLSVSQSAQARLTAVPVVLLTARPYGVYRDALFRRLDVHPDSGTARRTTVDTVAFVSFQLPIYWGILALTGASAGQIAISSAAAVVVIIVSGRPYGLLLELVRRLFSVPAAPPGVSGPAARASEG